MGGVGTPSSEDLDPYPTNDARTTATPSTAKSLETAGGFYESEKH